MAAQQGDTGRARARRHIGTPVGLQAEPPRFGDRVQGSGAGFLLVLDTDLFVIGAYLCDIGVARIGRQALYRRNAARSVGHVDHRPRIIRRDLHRRVRARGSGAADEQRQLQAQALHLVRDVRHLFERGRDQAGKPDRVGLLALRCFQDGLCGDHHAEIDDIVVVALQDYGDDVLADVVYVALDLRKHNPSLVARRFAGARLFRLDVGYEVRYRLFHHARRFHHLRQEHLAGAKQLADDIHAVHQRPFDHLDRARQLEARFLGVGDDVRRDAVDQRVRQALLDAAGAPGFVLARFLRGAFDPPGELHQALGRVRTPVEDHVFDMLAQFRDDLLVHAELPGVDDAHRHSVAGRVIEESRLHRVGYPGFAAEAAGQLLWAARTFGLWQ